MGIAPGMTAPAPTASASLIRGNTIGSSAAFLELVTCTTKRRVLCLLVNRTSQSSRVHEQLHVDLPYNFVDNIDQLQSVLPK